MNKPSDIIVRVDPEIRELIPDFLENRKQEALSMKTFSEQKDFTAIHKAAHTFRGASGNYGFDALAQAGAALEAAAQDADADKIKSLLKDIQDLLNRIKVVYE
jgi:HPt (histidine-containing phosphotransfer) domain-containing protein